MTNTINKKYSEAIEIEQLIKNCTSILIIQADNPDSDSLGSALLIESIASKFNKSAHMYCGIDIPSYIKYIDGWGRVEKTFPKTFDLTIFVDVSTLTLFEKLTDSMTKKIQQNPVIVLDHHKIIDNGIDYATMTINDSDRASTGELIYLLSKQLEWQLDTEDLNLIANTILGDTQGLSNQLASADTYHIMGELIEAGVDRPLLEEKRRQYSKMPHSIFQYKADLIKKTEFFYENRIALTVINQEEINKYSPLYNPSALIQGDILQTENVLLAVVFKNYNDGRITASIRCNSSAPIAASLAQDFGGGGHDYASGFKTHEFDINEIKSKLLNKAQQLLLELKQ